ncbi:MAG: Glucose-6-phosphate isomerase [Turneriella sp.]|nr:Glucose-6-phosphate isomerase [Turneriella sp.]
MAQLTRFSANKTWMNWQSLDRAHELDTLMHAGGKKWPAAFSTEYMKADALGPIEKWAAELRQIDIHNLIVIGIGGSSLGGIALKALTVPHSDRLIFWEGPHPMSMQHIAQIAEKKQAAVLVVSKSGTTLETRANLSLLRQFFPGLPEFFVTSEIGQVKDLGANEKNTFLIPKPLGGRFSIVSPVGMMPALFVDYNVKAFLTAFAEANAEWELAIPVAENVAKQTAIHFYNLFAARFTGVAFWVYAADLVPWGRWLVQLWAESLGKKPHIAALPMVVQGPEDQHSLLQYFMEASNNHLHCFIHTESYGSRDTLVPPDMRGDYADKSLSQILTAQMRSIEAALSAKERPVAEYILGDIGEAQMARWFCFWMHVVSYLGYLWEVNPFDQPGVEAGKIICKKLLRGERVDEAVHPVFDL